MGWDGATTFHQVQHHAFWPLTYSVLNFPVELRNKYHIGLHIASLDTGIKESIAVVVEELIELWEQGILHEGVTYKVAVVVTQADGRDYEKLFGVQGAGSLAGCYKCNFNGVFIEPGRVIYRGHRKYLDKTHEYRKKTISKSVLFKKGIRFETQENGTEPLIKTWDDYERDSTEAVRLK